MSVLREVRIARKYFVGSQYHDAATSLLEGLATDTPEQTASKIRALPTEETLFSQLTERLKGKSVIKNLKKLGEGRESPQQKSIALSSLLTHVLIETSSHKEYGVLIPTVTKALVEALDEHASFGHLFEDGDPVTGNENEEAPAATEGGEENTLMSFGSGKYYYLVKNGDDLKVVDALGTVMKEGHGDVAAFVRPIMSEFGDLVSKDFLEKYDIMKQPEMPPVAAPGEGPDGKPLPMPAGGGGHGSPSAMPTGGEAAPAPEAGPEGAPSADAGMPSGNDGSPTEGAPAGDGVEPPVPEGEGEQTVEEPPQDGAEPPAEEPAPEVTPAEEPAAEGTADEEPAQEFTPEEREEIDRQARRVRT